MNDQLIKKVKVYCKNLLDNSRCKSFQFHNYQHTLNVVASAKLIAQKSQLCEEEIEMIVISSYFHDVGNIKESKKHELLSCSIARNFLAKESYPEEKIKTIEQIILATEISREPKTILEKIIRDADLSHLGKDSFLNQNKQLRKEWSNFLGLSFTDQEWFHLNMTFFENHQFYTDVAQSLYDIKKNKNIHEFQQQF